MATPALLEVSEAALAEKMHSALSCSFTKEDKGETKSLTRNKDWVKVKGTLSLN